MAQRLFLALWPGDDMRRALADWRDAWTWPSSATPVPDPKLHLTLHFLGDVDDTMAQALANAEPVAFPPIPVTLGIPALWHGHIAVLEPITPPAALFDLQTALGRQLQDLGFTLETRPYRPHVTMARRAAGATPPPARPPLDWDADTYALVRSDSDSYTVVRHFGR
jgi:2'-5' RNA ligase